MPIDRVLLVSQELARERSLKTLRKIQDNFINTMSHEVRTPLTSIIGFADLLTEDEQISPEERKEFVRIIRDEGRRLAALVNDCLDLSKLEKGISSLERAAVDVVELLGHTIKAHQPEMQRKQLIVAVDTHEERMVAMIDQDRIRRALSSVLANSVKYTPAGGRVFLKLRRVGEFVEIQVWDEGPQIPVEQLRCFFSAFSDENHPAKGIRGTGLGLAIARYLLELHGGSIGVRSKPGRGTTFFLRFPAS